MVNIKLAWYPRIMIWLRIGTVQAPNMQIASTLYRVMEKIRPSEKERDETQLTADGQGYRWLLPHLDYGTRTVELESEEAEQLAGVLENPPQGSALLVADMEWLLPLIARLKAKEELVPIS